MYLMRDKEVLSDLDMDPSSTMKEKEKVVLVRYADGESLNLENVLFTTCLEVNIPSLGNLDDQGCKTTLHGDLLTIFDQKGKKITKIKKSGGRLYHLKLNIETCLFTKEEEGTVWL